MHILLREAQHRYLGNSVGGSILEFKRISQKRCLERLRLAGQGQGQLLRRRAKDRLPESKPERLELAGNVQRLETALNRREIELPVVEAKGRVVWGDGEDVVDVQVRMDPAAMSIHIGAERLTVSDPEHVPEVQQVFIRDGSEPLIGPDPRRRKVVIF